MRTHRIFIATLVAGAAVVATGGVAAANQYVGPHGGCSININVAPRQITVGDPVVIFGRLHCKQQANEARQTVILYHRLAGQSSFSVIQTGPTDANGYYEFTRNDGVVNTNRSWYVRARNVRSGVKSVRVAAQVTLVGPLPAGKQLYTGPANKVTFTGTVNPADVGANVILQRQNAASGGDDWVRIDHGVVAAGGNFSITHKFTSPGDANIRVLVRSQGRNIPSPSNVLEYEISQAQHPNLTITASADPITFGQSVTISGTLASGANMPVTLLAKTYKQKFAVVAQVQTDASGNYSFAPQSPVYSTIYYVKGGGKSSAQLYEGVHDALTALASATTVVAGQPVTFTGTVGPDHTGHVIYLERKNATGDDFHVVQVSHLVAGSTYSITHRFYDAGTKVVRVYIPGGPENEGAASTPFTIGVTPAPPPTLTPEPGSNSSPPGNGQQ